MTIIMKFGGTSVGSGESIRTLTQLVQERQEKQPVLVVSAVSKTTDALVNAIHHINDYKEHYDLVVQRQHDVLNELGLDETLVDELLQELHTALEQYHTEHCDTKQAGDHIASFGERMSARIVAAFLSDQGIAAQAYDAYDLGLVTDDSFSEAHPLEESSEKIATALSQRDHIPIITGFIAKTKDGMITTLGRGGSDFSAAYFGAALNVEEIQIWTDVDGILSADPRKIPNVKLISEISFTEASELAYFGAKVVHPKTLLPAIDKDIPVFVKNTHNPSSPGTRIHKDSQVSDAIVKAITSKSGNTLINVNSSRMLFAHGFLAKLFEIFAKHQTSIDVVTTSEVSVSMTITNDEHLDAITKDLEGIGTVTLLKQKSIICLVGEGIQQDPGIFGRVFSLLSQQNIPVDMISQGASKINLTFVVNESHAEDAVKILHEELIGGAQ